MKKVVPLQLVKRPFSAHEAVSLGLSKATLTRMVKTGHLDRLSRGVYQESGGGDETGEDRYRIAALRCGTPSVICLLSALEHYHVTDQIPKEVWILVPESKRIASKELKLVRSRNPQWNLGIRKTKQYWITTLERTLIDGLVYRRLIGSQVALEAMKQAVAQKKVKLGDLYDMAKKMGVEHRVRPYIEALAS